MKTLARLVVLMILMIVALNGCEDKKAYCWECENSVTTSFSTDVPGYPKTVTSTTKYCDKTKAEAKVIEEKMTYSRSDTLFGVVAKMESTMKCKKK